MRRTFADLNGALDSAYARIGRGDVEGGLGSVARVLHGVRLLSTAKDWQVALHIARSHPVAAFIAQSPLHRRDRTFQRGVSSDPIGFDLVCNVDDAKRLGPSAQAVLAFERSLPTVASLALRNRTFRLRNEAGADVAEPKCVLALQSGHTREWDMRLTGRYHAESRIVIAGSDRLALAAAARRVPDHRVRPVWLRDRSLIGADATIAERPFDFVSGAFMLDDLSREKTEQLVRDIFVLLLPGGSMLAPILSRDRSDDGYVEAFVDANLLEHDEHELLDLASSIPDALCRSRVYRDATSYGLYLEITRVRR